MKTVFTYFFVIYCDLLTTFRQEQTSEANFRLVARKTRSVWLSTESKLTIGRVLIFNIHRKLTKGL